MKHMKMAVGLTIGLALSTLIGCNLKKKPPPCDDAQVMALARSALQNAPANRGRFLNFTLGIPGETRYRANPPKRVCRTSLSSSFGNEILFYSVEWQNEKRGIIWVQTMGNRDDGT